MFFGKKKIAALALGAMLGLGGTTAFAAQGADQFTDVPRGHWSYEALDYLAKKGLIDGMGDNTFQGGRNMTRYEMASVVYKLDKAVTADIASKSVMDKLRQEFASEIDALKKQVGQNTEDIKDLKEKVGRFKFYGFLRAQYDNDPQAHKYGPWQDEHTNRRFLLDLKGEMRVNDQWTATFQIETNQRYSKNVSYGADRNRIAHTDFMGEKDWGSIQRIWANGHLKHGVDVNFGRRWVGLGYQNALLGATVNGVDVSVPIAKNGFRFGLFYYSLAEYGNGSFGFWGPTFEGPTFKLGSGYVGLKLAWAQLTEKRKNPLRVAYNGDSTAQGNWIGKGGFVAGLDIPIVKNVHAQFDYVQTDHKASDNFVGEGVNLDRNLRSNQKKNNHSYLARLEYKWANPSVKHSFNAYVGYHYIGRNGYIWADDCWGSRPHNSKGWTVGFKYVPWKNILWETFYTHQNINMQQWSASDPQFKRNLIRTQVDFCF